MSEALEAINALIAQKAKPETATIQLSQRCFELAIAETNGPIDVSDSLYVERWLYGQWVAAFELMPSLSQAGFDVHTKLTLHLCGVSAAMKRLNVPYWHLFTDMTNQMYLAMGEIFGLVAQRQAIMEKEGSNEPLH